MNSDDPDFDDDAILLHGVSLPAAESEGQRTATSPDDDNPPIYTLRPTDDAIPGRDFQPRLFRFGEAA